MKIHNGPNFIAHNNGINANTSVSRTKHIIPMSPTRHAIINNQAHNGLQSKVPSLNIKGTTQILARAPIGLSTSSLNPSTHISAI
jgi:hypothetical protein